MIGEQLSHDRRWKRSAPEAWALSISHAKSGKRAEALQTLQARLPPRAGSGIACTNTRPGWRSAIEAEAHVAAAQSHLTMLGKDAREHGALLVASQAQALAASNETKK